MNVTAFRHFFEYHFTINRTIWNQITQLTPDQFAQEIAYAHGSVRNQLFHLIDVDDVWFSDLRGVEPGEELTPESLPDYAAIRARWDAVEQNMRDYLAGLQDEMLEKRPLSGEDKDLRLWQVLLHVVNHGTDHRAQLLRTLNDFGIKTPPQDYIFFVYDNLV